MARRLADHTLGDRPHEHAGQPGPAVAAMTTRSNFPSCARRTISAAGGPSVMRNWQAMPPAFSRAFSSSTARWICLRTCSWNSTCVTGAPSMPTVASTNIDSGIECATVSVAP